MLKRNITGQEFFDIDGITNKKLNIVNYENISRKIGYPFNIDYVDGLKFTNRYNMYIKKNDYSLYGMYESKKIANIIPPSIVSKNIYSRHPMFFELFPKTTKDIVLDLSKSEIDDILVTPKNVSLSVPDTTSIQYDVDGMTEEQRIIKKMTQDNIDESGDIGYYENFLKDHLNKKYAVPLAIPTRRSILSTTRPRPTISSRVSTTGIQSARTRSLNLPPHTIASPIASSIASPIASSSSPIASSIASPTASSSSPVASSIASSTSPIASSTSPITTNVFSSPYDEKVYNIKYNVTTDVLISDM